MAIRKKHQSRDQRRYTRSSTKRGFVLRKPAHPGRIVAIALAAVATVALALVWGSYLKKQSDAYREALEMGEWTVDPTIAVPHPVPVPELRAMEIYPEGNVGDILIEGKHHGVIMTLTPTEEGLPYTSAVAASAGRPMAPEAVSLADDVARVHKRGLRVICAFRLTCFEAEDPATRTYLQGLEMAMIREYAEAGMDDLLLFGLPTGTKESDYTAVEFLNRLRTLLSDLPEPPSVGVALPLSCFSTDATYTPTDPEGDALAGVPEGTTPLYAGNVTPARILSACDFLAMDLRALTSEEVTATLPHIRYVYVRYSLRLLTDRQTPAATEDALSHGFERIFEMDPSVEKNDTETAAP